MDARLYHDPQDPQYVSLGALGAQGEGENASLPDGNSQRHAQCKHQERLRQLAGNISHLRNLHKLSAEIQRWTGHCERVLAQTLDHENFSSVRPSKRAKRSETDHDNYYGEPGSSSSSSDESESSSSSDDESSDGDGSEQKDLGLETALADDSVTDYAVLCSAPKECLVQLKAMKKGIGRLAAMIQETADPSTRAPARKDFVTAIHGYASDGLFLLRKQNYAHLQHQYSKLLRKYNSTLHTLPHHNYSYDQADSRLPFAHHPGPHDPRSCAANAAGFQQLARRLTDTSEALRKAHNSGTGLANENHSLLKAGASGTQNSTLAAMVSRVSQMAQSGPITVATENPASLLLGSAETIQRQRRIDLQQARIEGREGAEVKGHKAEADTTVTYAETVLRALEEAVNELQPAASDALQRWKSHDYSLQQAAEQLNVELGCQPHADTPNYPLEIRNQILDELKRNVQSTAVFSNALHLTKRLTTKQVRISSGEDSGPSAAVAPTPSGPRIRPKRRRLVDPFLDQQPLSNRAYPGPPSERAVFSDTSKLRTQQSFWLHLFGEEDVESVCAILRSNQNILYTSQKATNPEWLWQLLLNDPDRQRQCRPNSQTVPIEDRVGTIPDSYLEPSILFKCTEAGAAAEAGAAPEAAKFALSAAKRTLRLDEPWVGSTMVDICSATGKAGFFYNLMETGNVLHCLPKSMSEFWYAQKERLRAALEALPDRSKQSAVFKERLQAAEEALPESESTGVAYDNLIEWGDDMRHVAGHANVLLKEEAWQQCSPAFGNDPRGTTNHPWLVDDMVVELFTGEIINAADIEANADFKEYNDSPYMRAANPLCAQSPYAALYPKTVGRYSPGDEPPEFTDPATGLLMPISIDPDTGLRFVENNSGKICIDLVEHCTDAEVQVESDVFGDAQEGEDEAAAPAEDAAPQEEITIKALRRKKIEVDALLAEQSSAALQEHYPVTTFIEIGRAFVQLMRQGKFIADFELRCLDEPVMMGVPPMRDAEGNIETPFHTHFNGIEAAEAPGNEDSLPNLSIYYWTAVMLLMESVAHDKEKQLKREFELVEAAAPTDSESAVDLEKRVNDKISNELVECKQKLFLVARCINAPRLAPDPPRVEQQPTPTGALGEEPSRKEGIRKKALALALTANRYSQSFATHLSGLPAGGPAAINACKLKTWSEIMLCLAADQYGHAYYTDRRWHSERAVFQPSAYLTRWNDHLWSPPSDLRSGYIKEVAEEIQLGGLGYKVDLDRIFLDRFFGLMTAHNRAVAGRPGLQLHNLTPDRSPSCAVLPYCIGDPENAHRFAAYFHVFDTARSRLDQIQCPECVANFDLSILSPSACMAWLYDWAKEQICWQAQHATGNIKRACELQPLVRQAIPEIETLRDVLGPAFDPSDMVRDRLKQCHCIAMGQTVLADLLQKHPHLRHPDLTISLMFDIRRSDFHAEFSQLVGMHIQLLRRFNGTKMSYAMDARATATNYRVMCYVFQHARMRKFVVGEGGSQTQWYLLDDRQGAAGCSRADAKCRGVAADALSLHTCQIVTQGKLVKAKERQLRSLRDTHSKLQSRDEEIKMATKNAKLAEVNYRFLKAVLAAEKQQLEAQRYPLEHSQRMRALEAKEREFAEAARKLENPESWSQLTYNALHTASSWASKAAQETQRLYTGMQSALGPDIVNGQNLMTYLAAAGYSPTGPLGPLGTLALASQAPAATLVGKVGAGKIATMASWLLQH